MLFLILEILDINTVDKKTDNISRAHEPIVLGEKYR